MLNLNPVGIANNSIAPGGDMFFPDLFASTDSVSVVQGNSSILDQFSRSGSQAGGKDFFGQLFKTGGETILGGARALGTGFIEQLGRNLAGNNDAQEREVFGTLPTAQPVPSNGIDIKVIGIGAAVLAVVLGMVLFITRR